MGLYSGGDGIITEILGSEICGQAYIWNLEWYADLIDFSPKT